MTAPFVERTIQKIEAESDRLTRSLMRAELACYWARVGEFEQAEKLRADLRSEFGDGKSPRVSIMIMCLEGLLLYFRDLGNGAKDRLDRARLLSGAMQDSALVAFTSAWQAHIAFNRYDFDQMATAADACFASVSERDLGALSRITLVMGDLFAYLRERPISQAWYSAARDFALKLGDHATLGAITYNRAALRVFETRLQAIAIKPSDEDLDLLDAEVRSAINYQALAELRSLDHLLGSAQVGSLVLRGQFASGLLSANTLLAANVVQTNSPQHALLLADAAHCSAALGHVDAANDLVDQCELIDAETFPVEERALLYSQIDTAAWLAGRGSNQDRRALSVEALLDTLERQLARLRSQMTRFQPVPDVVRRAASSV
jgi:hypothetical protein